MDGSGLFSLSASEQIEKFEEWVEVPVSITKLINIEKKSFAQVEKKPEPEKPKDEPKEEEKKEQGEPMDTGHC